MAWYRSGTISVTNGSTAVTGSGTAWIANVSAGESLYAPDGKQYEIASINSDTTLTLATAYLGSNQTGQSYFIIPTQSYLRDLAGQAAALVNSYSSYNTTSLVGKFNDGTLTSPGISFSSDQDTGFRRTGSGTFAITNNGTDTVSFAPTGVGLAGPLTLSSGAANGVLYLNGSKVATSGSALTFDGTNLGIGTSSPGVRLDVVGGTGASGAVSSITTVDNPAAGRDFLRLVRSGTGTIGSLEYSESGAVGLTAASAVVFKTGSTERMRLDPSGNLGLGVTPSAWVGRIASQVYSVSLASPSGSPGIGEMSTNRYLATGGTDRYIYSAPAMVYQQDSGAHKWFTAPSGTAGNPITFTQAMTLDASGNLLLGTTSRIASGGTALAFNSSTANHLVLADTRSFASGAGPLIMFSGKYNTAGTPYTNFAYIQAAKENATDGNNAGALVFATAPNGGGTAERARIDSSGNLLVGTTSVSDSPASGVQLNNIGSVGRVAVGHVSGAVSGDLYANFAYNGGAIGSITQNGTTAVAYNTTSDHRLKENVRPADAARFMDIEFVDFEWVDGRHDCGVIAHQLQSVYPDLVLGEKDATETRTVEITPAVPEVKDEEGNVVTEAVPAVTEDQEFPVYQQVNYTGLIGRMGTRLQSVIRENEELKTQMASVLERLAALEAP